MGEVIRSVGQGCTVSIGWERLSGVRAKMYGKHRMVKVIGLEGEAVVYCLCKMETLDNVIR